ncbi:MAG: heme exporter protein CcmD [Marinobacter sp. 34-60-7]|nr:MAG: heme exporter protein CcmD [Marinobacter sp. 34-60-7]
MAFDSFAAFIAMEGHGPYVWACYAVFAVLMAGLMVMSVRANRRVKADIARYHQRQQGGAQSTPAAPASFARVDVSQD